MSRLRTWSRLARFGATGIILGFGLLCVERSQAAFSSVTASSASSFAAAASFCTSPGGATLTPVADTEVDENQPTWNNGSKIIMTVGRGTLRRQRVLVRFNLAAIPAGCTATTATLRLIVPPANAGAGGPGKVLQVGEAATAWDESTVTWNTQPATAGSISTATTTATDVQFSVVAQVNTQRAGTNYGLLVKDQDESGAESKSVYSSREGTDLPTLTLVWS